MDRWYWSIPGNRKALHLCYGSVVSEVDGGTIENVINDVDITVKNDANGYARGKVGGVVANASFCSEKDPNGGDPTLPIR